MRPLIGLSCLALALAADEGSKHYHGGKLSKYEIGPPALLLSESDEARLRSGRPVMQTVESDDSDSKRLIMVSDIKAPASIVLGYASHAMHSPVCISTSLTLFALKMCDAAASWT